MAKERIRKTQFVLRGDLEERALKHASSVSMDLHDFVNQCVEGIIQALESDDASYNIPLLRLGRLAEGKSWLDTGLIYKVIAMLYPKDYAQIQEGQRSYRTYLAEFISKHQGPLTKEAWDAYSELANEKNKARAAEEKRLAKVRNLNPEGK